MSLLFAGVLLLGLPGLARAGVVLADPLVGGTSGNQEGGEFTGGGWKAPHQIWWDLGEALSEGTLSVEVTNWNPNDDSPQHHHDKQHIINMYEAPHGSAWGADDSDPKTDFFNLRTGATYDNCYKFLSSTAGFAERHETRVKKGHGTIEPSQTYTLSVQWWADGTITSFIDGQPQVTHEHDTSFSLRYVFIGTDDTIPGTYGPQHGVVYKNLVVTGAGGAAVVPPPEEPEPEPPVETEPSSGGDDPLQLQPVADTWANPGAPEATHGSSTELRVGGDGRTIYLKFDVQGVGSVEDATLHLQALNGGYGGDVYVVDDTSWDEGSLTYTGKPDWSPSPLASLGWVTIGETYAVAVSDAVICDGEVAFAIRSTEEDGAGFWSREAGDPGPRLILKADPAGTPCTPEEGEGEPSGGEEQSPPPDPAPEPSDESPADTPEDEGDASETPPEPADPGTVPDPSESPDPQDVDALTGGDGAVWSDTSSNWGPGGNADASQGVGFLPPDSPQGLDPRPSRGTGGGCVGSHSGTPLAALPWALFCMFCLLRRRTSQRA